MPGASEHVGVTQIVGRLNLPLQRVQSPIVGYALAFFCVAIALGLALALQHYEFREVGLPVLSLAVGIATWFGGIGPAVLAVMLSAACFNYFFTEPNYSFEINARDLPYFFVFVAWAVIVAWFSAISRRIEQGLRQAHDRLLNAFILLKSLKARE
jgi:K+-sensing histidine kinase KdpD